MNIEKFVENLNKLSKVKIRDIGLLNNSIYAKKEEIKNKKNEILDELEEVNINLNKYDEKEVIKVLGLKNMNRATLEEMITTTGKHVYILLNELKTLNINLQGFENFKKNIDKDGYIHPKFSVNVNGMVSVAEPALARLDDSFITSILGYSSHKEFTKFDNLYNFIKSYRPMLGVRPDNQNSFIVVGMTLFYDFKKIKEWDITEAYEEKVADFYNNYYGFEGADALKETRYNRIRAKFVTSETYHVFDEVYNELSPILEVTKIATKNGLVYEEWFGSLPRNFFPDVVDEMELMPFGASTNQELEEEHKEGLKRRMDGFNNLYNQYIELKGMVEKGEDISEITKEEEILSEIREAHETRIVNRKYDDEGLRGEDLRQAVKIELYSMMKRYDVKAGVKAEQKQEQPTSYEPANLKIFDMNKNREIMRGYGWAEDIIERNMAEIQAVEDNINANFNNPNFKLCGKQYSDTVFDSICAGRGKIIATRMLIDRDESSQDIKYDIWFGLNKVRQTLKVIAPKGSAHRTLHVIYPSGEIKTYTASNKQNNIMQITTEILNTLV